MRFRKLINNRQEYWEFILPFIEWSLNPDQNLWHEEDLPKLQPFLKRNHNDAKDWTLEILESFEFYKQCCAAYGDKNKELRDTFGEIGINELLDAFGYEYFPDYDEDEEIVATLDNPLPLVNNFDATFPFVVVGDCGENPSGSAILSVHKVSLRDFI